MRFVRQPYIIMTTIVACTLLIGGLAQWKGSGIGAGIYSRHEVVYIAASCVGAMGVICLAWHWLMLVRGITSIAQRLRLNEQVKSDGMTAGPWPIGRLCREIDDCITRCSGADQKLHEQIKQLQLQVRLSGRQTKNTEAIIYSLRDAVVVTDEFDRLSMANEAAGSLFSFDPQTAQHKAIDELIDKSKSEFVVFLRQSRQSRAEAVRREIQFVLNRMPKTYDCVISCVHDHDKQICGVVAVLHDVTREKEISQMKNDFVSHVSHELKTPLASITAYSEMLADGEAEDEQTRKQFYAVIQNQALRLNRLIEDILNISRIESGLIKVDKKPVSLAILIEEQLEMIKGYAEEKNIRIIAQKPIVYDQAYADKDMISQVIVNLLSNAVKYTPSGGSVKIKAAVDEAAGTAQVTVTDTGVGIPKEDLEHVFDKFFRVEANKKQAKGTGLGLNLVKQIVENVHGGRVFVTSEQGIGSTFGFDLPLATGNSKLKAQNSKLIMMEEKQ